MSILSGTNIIHAALMNDIKYAKKNRTISIRLSEPDYDSLVKIAEKYGISTSTFLRCWICSVIDFEEELTEIEKNENII